MRFHLSFDCQSFLCVFGFLPLKKLREAKRELTEREGEGEERKREGGELNLRASKAPLIISAVRTINLALRLYKIYRTGNTGSTWVQYNSDFYLDFIYLWKIENIKKTTCSASLQRTKGGNVCVINLMSKDRERREREKKGSSCVVWHIKLLSLPPMQSGAI